MRRLRPPILVGCCALAVAGCGAGATLPPGTVNGIAGADPTGGTGTFVLTATNTGPTYEPTFTGNGELGIRVPPAGQGYAGGTVPTQAELAGFYAQPPGGVQQRANIPTWSTLAFSAGGSTFALSSGHTTGWRQSIDFRTGVITTSALWTAPNGQVTQLSYQVLTDRARAHVGLVRLTLQPRWTGTAAVTDVVDGSPATLSTQVGKSWVPSAHRDSVTVRAVGTGIEAAIASQLAASDNVHASTTEINQSADQSVGQVLSFGVTAGRRYTFTKYVGITTSQESSSPTSAAQSIAAGAAGSGFGALMTANNSAWAALWSGRIDVLGNPSLASQVNASEFYLWSSTRDGVDWSISPAGLSSNGYSGHIFWDAETWMYPALLAQHPDLASGINEYRYARLAAARAHAVSTGYQGTRFPWESALDGTEQIAPPASVFTEGVYEQHISSDVALAQWQYFEATGDKKWLADRGWPVLSGVAAFWASRAVAGSHHTYDIDGVTGPDEYNTDVDDEVYTNAAAATVLQDAVQAARIVGAKAPTAWSRIASGLLILSDTALDVTPEFSGYDAQLIKQADATLLEYPLGYPIPVSVARNNVDFYAPRTDPGGPSMSDSVNSIDTSQSGTPGCASYVFTVRSVQPFIRDVFDQFSETKTGGVLTFMTGIGGFLQEFLYGYSGLRWEANGVRLSPTLTGQLGGVVLHDLSWHGRQFTVAIGQQTTTVSVTGGGTLPVLIGSTTKTVGVGQSLSVATRRPDLQRSGNRALCQPATATSAQPGAPALAAVDGSRATDWQPRSLPATITVPLSAVTGTIDSATLVWGQQWPPPPGTNLPPPPGPVSTLRANSYTVAVSGNGSTWKTVATVVGRTTGSIDVLHFPAVQAHDIRVSITVSASSQPPSLDELTVGT
ncbi:MAG: glycosyl hydrolase family 65 protein [Acidimicrobiales bacterium]|jgi:trehalose/maltose hydrolase-like predicted phosphorylase